MDDLTLPLGKWRTEALKAYGNAIKYLWRAGLKTDANRDARDKEIEDLQKAIWYINDRIAQLRQN